MDKKKALRMLESAKMPDDYPAWAEAVREAGASLRREVEREEAEKPKRPSLEEQEKTCRDWIGARLWERDPNNPTRWDRMEAAADTLRTLREEAPKLQRWVRLLADKEMASLLLLAAIVGALILAKRRIDG